MSLQDRLLSDMKTAMRERDEVRLSVIRLLRSEIKNAEIESGSALTDEEIVEVVARDSKRRRDAIEQFRKGGRYELVEKELAELEVVLQYLPEQLDEIELAGIAQEVISELGATSSADKGRVMGALMQRVRGRADGKLVSRVVDELLARCSE